MLTDHSPLSKIQLSSLVISDHSPLSSLLQNYLISCQVEGKSPYTIEAYHRRLRDFLTFSNGQDVTQIDAGHIRLYLLSLQARNLQPSTVNAIYRVLHTWFDWLVREGELTKSPMANIRSPKTPKKAPTPFSKEDIENLLLLTSRNRFLDIRNHALILLFLDTGLRLSEMASIHLQDVDFDHAVIKVIGKGVKQRTVSMGRRTQKAVLRYLLKRDDSSEDLWVTHQGEPLTRTGIQIGMRRLAKRANIHDARCGPHSFRHTFATWAIRNGANLFYVQLLLGQSALDMTRRYASKIDSEEAIKAHASFSPVGVGFVR
jgi:site-specific recombinase XerD